MITTLAAASLFLLPALPQATILELGLAPNGESPIIVDMSGDGRFACGMAGPRAFHWSELGGFTLLPPSPILGDDPEPTCMSDDGRFVGGNLASDLNVVEAFRWSLAGGYELLPAVSGQVGIALASVSGLSGDGSMATGTSYDTDIDQPAVWDATGTGRILELPAPARFGQGEDVSMDGQVVVGFAYDLGFPSGRGVRWVEGQAPIVLPPPSGVQGALATAVSRDGLVAFGTAIVDQSFDSLTGCLRWNAVGDVEFIDGLPSNTIRVRPLSADATGSAVVGSYEFDSAGFSERSFYWSDATGYQTIPQLAAANGLSLPGSLYRIYALSTDGNALAVRGALPTGSASFRTFILRLAPDPQISTSGCTPGIVNSTGTWAKLSAFGSQAVIAEDVELRASDLPQGSYGMYLASTTPDTIPVFGGSSGTLCLGGGVGRFDGPGQVLRAGVLGRTVLRIDLNAIPQPTGPVAILPGSEWFFQYWYRDRVGQMSTSNFSESCSVIFQ